MQEKIEQAKEATVGQDERALPDSRWLPRPVPPPCPPPVSYTHLDVYKRQERLTMNSRPKQPKYARNKNILVIGGSGSGSPIASNATTCSSSSIFKPRLMARL